MYNTATTRRAPRITRDRNSARFSFDPQNRHGGKSLFARSILLRATNRILVPSSLSRSADVDSRSPMHFSLPRHRHSPCLGTFSRISGHFVIAPPPSPTTSFSVLPRPLLLLLRPRLLLLPPPPPPLLPLPPPASPPSTSGDSSRCYPLSSSSSFLRFFL